MIKLMKKQIGCLNQTFYKSLFKLEMWNDYMALIIFDEKSRPANKKGFSLSAEFSNLLNTSI